jgi:hypothetical protein
MAGACAGCGRLPARVHVNATAVQFATMSESRAQLAATAPGSAQPANGPSARFDEYVMSAIAAAPASEASIDAK